jgi:hypothetical protein
MYTYKPSEAGRDSIKYYPHSANDNKNKVTNNKCCTIKKTFIIAGILLGVAVVFTSGYLIRHYFPHDSINEFLGHNQEQCKNMTEMQIQHHNTSSYIN